MARKIKSRGATFTALVCVGSALLFSGCPELDKATNLNTNKTAVASSTASGSSGSVPIHYSEYQNAKSVKVVFNKQSFYNNFLTNSSGCAGDARLYYDPVTDRQVPTKPSWLRNVAVELTNSNALDGPSYATGCSLVGSGSPTAANCATFDDLQPLSGAASRAIVVGGMGCASNTSGCSALANSPTLKGDIWQAYIPNDADDMTWAKQNPALSVFGVAASPGLAWAGGDFDELHNEFYIFGGVNAPDNTSTNLEFSNSVVKLSFNTDKSVSNTTPPATVTTSTRRNFGGWALDGAFNVALAAYFTPPSLVGNTFTYSSRRDPTSKSWCLDGDAQCSATAATESPVQVNNEHSDYFLLTGGIFDDDGVTAPFDDDYFTSKHFWMYKPHGISNSAGATAPSGGDWILLSNDEEASAALGNIMKVIEISNTGVAEDFWSASNATWNGRAFHRTVYDPTMNRFYIFGGIEASANATTTIPTLGDNDIWIYDPPALGRRPTAGCYVAETPNNVAIPTTSATLGIGTSSINVNRAYLGEKWVFPPGGCLQRIQHTTAPDARFEQAMAFDREQKAVVVFGGCESPSVIGAEGSSTAGDPTSNCVSSTALFNDTWLYLPPTTMEFVSNSYQDAGTSPYSVDGTSAPYYRLSNIFGTDFWLDYFPMYQDNNNSSVELTKPTDDQILGTWIQMNPTTSPTKRSSASFYYDRAHKKFYLHGGFGCRNTSCSDVGTINDLWEYTPPNLLTQCDRESGTCSSNGTWTQIKSHNDAAADQPTARKGAVTAHAEPMFSFADDFYTVTDTSCVSQGPVITGDSSSNKQYVGAIYIDIDREKIESGRHLVINLRFLPFDQNTKLPGLFNNNTPTYTSDDSENASINDQALIRVQLINNPVNFWDQIQSLIQPRFHEFLNNVPVISRDLTYVAGGTGQVTEKQILIPLNGVDTSFDMIKIERIQGSVKFYEMAIYQY